MNQAPELLAAFYQEVTNEIRRLREEQWKLSYYFVAEGLAVILLLAEGKVEKFLSIWIMIPLIVLQIGCFVVYTHHLHANHSYIGNARYLRRKLVRFRFI
jgi:hypothetical protein